MNKEKNKKITLRTILVLVALVIFTLVAIVSLRAEYLNIKGIGTEYTSVFIQNIKNKTNVAIVSFMFTYITVYISNKIILSNFEIDSANSFK